MGGPREEGVPNGTGGLKSGLMLNGMWWWG